MKALLVLVALVISGVARFISVLNAPGVALTGQPFFGEKLHSQSNMVQLYAGVWMHEADGKLYFETDDRSFIPDRVICCIDDDELRFIADEAGKHLIGAQGDYLYFSDGGFYTNTRIIAMNVKTSEEEVLCEGGFYIESDTFIPLENDLYLLIRDQNGFRYLCIREGDLVSEDAAFPGYFAGDISCCFKPNKNGEPETLIACNNEGKMTQIDIGDDRVENGIIVPVGGGLIVFEMGDIDYSSGKEVFFIDETACLNAIFSVECFCCKKAVAVNESYCFVSVKRYSGYDAGDYRYLEYKDDTVSGTYRISLESFLVEKISDQFYDGLFIFDEDHVFACDMNRNVFQLDLDGRIVSKVLSVD